MHTPVFISLAVVVVCEGLGLWRIARRGLLPGLGFRASAPVLGYILALMTAAAYISVAWATPAVRHWAFNFSALKLLALAAALTAGFFEEVLFRGYLMNRLQKMGQGIAMQIIISGLAFGLAHILWVLPALAGGHGDVSAFLMPVAATTILGSALAIVYIASARSLGPVILSHFLIDAVIEPGLLISAFFRH